MQYTTLGSTSLRVSRLAFGAGPVPELMTENQQDRQRNVVKRALDCGINWFDTAATYGQGKSEANLGATLAALGASHDVYLATKVRVLPDQVDNIPQAVHESVAGSLHRLQVDRITLLQVHNAITAKRGDEPTSLTPADVLGPNGMLETFRQLQEDGVVGHVGITGIGQADALREIVRSGQIDTIQVPFNLMNPSAGYALEQRFPEANYGNIMADCKECGVGVFTIRVFAGGALAGRAPSAHTHKTPFFPLDLYQRDQQRAAVLCSQLGDSISTKEAALRFAVNHSGVNAAIIGFGAEQHLDEAEVWSERGALSEQTLSQIERWDYLGES
ncbi:MAG: aldo/keto reductase [Pirellulaceae bacterium]|nr:aldo/keto reductase [Pirellulaceae bacterium]